MVCKGLVSPRDGRCCIRVRLLLKKIYSALSSRLQALVLPVQAMCREEGTAPGQRGLARDMGLRMEVGKVNSADAPTWEGRHPTGLWVDRLQHWDGAGPLFGISLSCLAAKGSFTGKMQ